MGYGWSSSAEAERSLVPIRTAFRTRPALEESRPNTLGMKAVFARDGVNRYIMSQSVLILHEREIELEIIGRVALFETPRAYHLAETVFSHLAAEVRFGDRC
jgi:hypothetical protein